MTNIIKSALGYTGEFLKFHILYKFNIRDIGTYGNASFCDAIRKFEMGRSCLVLKSNYGTYGILLDAPKVPKLIFSHRYEKDNSKFEVHQCSDKDSYLNVKFQDNMELPKDSGRNFNSFCPQTAINLKLFLSLRCSVGSKSIYVLNRRKQKKYVCFDNANAPVELLNEILVLQFYGMNFMSERVPDITYRGILRIFLTSSIIHSRLENKLSIMIQYFHVYLRHLGVSESNQLTLFNLIRRTGFENCNPVLKYSFFISKTMHFFENVKLCEAEKCLVLFRTSKNIVFGGILNVKFGVFLEIMIANLRKSLDRSRILPGYFCVTFTLKGKHNIFDETAHKSLFGMFFIDLLCFNLEKFI